MAQMAEAPDTGEGMGHDGPWLPPSHGDEADAGAGELYPITIKKTFVCDLGTRYAWIPEVHYIDDKAFVDITKKAKVITINH